MGQGQYSAADLKPGSGQYSAADLSGAPEMDAFQRAVNYHTGNNWVDFPMGIAQGAAKGAANLGETIGAGTRALLGKPQADQSQVDLDTKPEGFAQGLGKFAEQGAEYALPAGEAARALKGVALLPRVAAQAGIGAGVSALQTHGDPTAMALGGAFGGAAELGGAAISGIKAAAGAKAPNIQNFRDAFGAVPTQTAAITKALPTLVRDGINPEASLPEMQESIKAKLQDIGQQYNALDPAIQNRLIQPDYVVQKLEQAQQQYMRRGVVTDEEGYAAIQKQIKNVQDIAAANNGELNVADLVHLKQNANGKTNFQSVDNEKTLWENIGDAYRAAADKLAPETTPLNRDYATYKQLSEIAAKNVGMGRGGVTQSVIGNLMKRAEGAPTGAIVGSTIGHSIAGGPGAGVGGLVGAVVYPKLAGTVRQALQNSIDSGAFARLSPATQALAKVAATIGDGGTVSKLLQRTPVTAVQSAGQ